MRYKNSLSRQNAWQCFCRLSRKKLMRQSCWKMNYQKKQKRKSREFWMCMYAWLREWMSFFRGQNKEELKEVAKGNEYLEGAYEDLVKMSLDEQKRLEYEAREKAILDYRSNMEGARNRGFQRGMEQGFERGITQGEQSMLIQLYRKNRLTLEEAAEEAKMP